MNKLTFKKSFIYRYLPQITLLVACILLILSIFSNSWQGNSAQVAEVTAKNVEKRVSTLESYIDKALDGPKDYYDVLYDLPEDLVIYIYKNDSLKFWSNQFPVLNDDISQKIIFQRLTNLKNRIVSPLTNITDEFTYTSLGPKWYLVKKIESESNETIIAGVEIQNTLINDLSRNDNGVNPRLNLPTSYSAQPLNVSGGDAITVCGKPVFKVLYDRTDIAPFLSNSLLRWIGLALFTLAVLVILSRKRTFIYYLGTLLSLSGIFWVATYWSTQMNNNTELFSPNTYADGEMFQSLGSLLLLNTFIMLCCISTYLIRNRIFCLVAKRPSFRKTRMAVYIALIAIVVAAILTYTQTTLKSLLFNSNISLELYRWNSDIPKTILVYFSYIGLLFCIMLLLQMTSPVLKSLLKIRLNFLSRKSLLIFALCTSVYFCATSGIIGFKREADRVEIWANRLAVNRDLDLEIKLLSVEEGIASDPVIAALSELNNSEDMILNRLSEIHLSRIRQNYSINALILDENNPGIVRHYTDLLMSSEPIADGSNFMCYYDALGSCRYIGLFAFQSQDMTYKSLIVEIESETGSDHRGYHSILGQFTMAGDINIPSMYSFAKYTDDKLVSYKGHFPYPTVIDDKVKTELKAKDSNVIRSDEYTHFLHRISDNEVIIISRPTRSTLVFFTSYSYTFLILLGLTQIFARTRKRRQFRSNFFKTRINIILFTSSTLILASLTVVSIFFVYKRNEDNMQNMMSSRISTIQALINTHTHNAQSYTDLFNRDFRSAMENISNTTKSDITLYTPDGKVFYSSAPEVFDKMLLGNRINHEAFHNISHRNQRLYISPEKIGDVSYWGLYAPIINNDREIIAIVGSPYTEEDMNFRREAFFHAALLINLFLLLLIISLLFSTREVNSMFSPLVEMGKKMNRIDIHNLEPIEYNRKDEISSLVEAYNRMVGELSDSTVRLAQVERDKAWSQMARQVAHEIKNPLTPIKLEIQRLIRLKENNNPKWEEKFDTVSAVILEHIDILTDTANEFSTFAKLYTEEPVLIDLEKTLKEQILIFNNKDNVSIEYIGMDSAIVMAPKPQFIRVIVNLLTNAIQAVEIRQKEEMEAGEEVSEGKVLVCLRNGAKDGFYDIVIDDNGPGVSEENQEKLFTPNFTTKSGGTGLGLAICRNIIEKCNGEIGYRKSYSLGGASFYISMPKS